MALRDDLRDVYAVFLEERYGVGQYDFGEEGNFVED